MHFSYKVKLFVVGVVLFACFTSATSSILAESVTESAAQEVLLIEADGTLVMAGGARMVLAGVVFPDYEAAVGRIMEMLGGRQVRVTRAHQMPDRYGRMAGVFVRRDGQDVAEVLLRNGLAVNWMRQGATSTYQLYMKAEQTAREHALGFWGRDSGRVLCVDRGGGLNDRAIGQLRVIQGRVLAVGRAGGNVYLNFGEDWQNDFTISLPQKQEDELLEGIAESFLGKAIEVRGWLRSENGPLVELSVPRQIVDLSQQKKKTGEASWEGNALACDDLRGVDQKS